MSSNRLVQTKSNIKDLHPESNKTELEEIHQIKKEIIELYNIKCFKCTTHCINIEEINPLSWKSMIEILKNYLQHIASAHLNNQLEEKSEEKELIGLKEKDLRNLIINLRKQLSISNDERDHYSNRFQVVMKELNSLEKSMDKRQFELQDKIKELTLLNLKLNTNYSMVSNSQKKLESELSFKKKQIANLKTKSNIIKTINFRASNTSIPSKRNPIEKRKIFTKKDSYFDFQNPFKTMYSKPCQEDYHQKILYELKKINLYNGNFESVEKVLNNNAVKINDLTNQLDISQIENKKLKRICEMKIKEVEEKAKSMEELKSKNKELNDQIIYLHTDAEIKKKDENQNIINTLKDLILEKDRIIYNFTKRMKVIERMEKTSVIKSLKFKTIEKKIQ